MKKKIDIDLRFGCAHISIHSDDLEDAWSFCRDDKSDSLVLWGHFIYHRYGLYFNIADNAGAMLIK